MSASSRKSWRQLAANQWEKAFPLARARSQKQVQAEVNVGQPEFEQFWKCRGIFFVSYSKAPFLSGCSFIRAVDKWQFNTKQTLRAEEDIWKKGFLKHIVITKNTIINGKFQTFMTTK